MTTLFEPTAPEEYGFLTRDAILSDCGAYRWLLTREYTSGGDGRTAAFLMLNPSTADHREDDPTIRRCLGFVRAWGMSRLVVANLFGFRATLPKDLLTAADPVGPEADRWLLHACAGAAVIVAAWGADVPFGRDADVLGLLARKPLTCLGLTKAGRPRHPLYMPGNAVPQPFPPTAEGVPTPC